MPVQSLNGRRVQTLSTSPVQALSRHVCPRAKPTDHLGAATRPVLEIPLGQLPEGDPGPADRSCHPLYRPASGNVVPHPPLTLEALLYPEFPLEPHAPSPASSGAQAFWAGPRYLAGDDGQLYETVAHALTRLGWANLTIVRGRQEPDETPQDRQVLRSTVLHISPDALRWAQWVLADEPFLLGGLPIAWQICARTDTGGPLAAWSAYFTPGVPGEAVADLLAALGDRDQLAVPLGGPELVLDAVTSNGWLRDIDQPHAMATDPMFTTCVSLGQVPPLIQDGDPRALTLAADEAGPAGWQVWAEPVLGAPCLWAASFSAGVPQDLVAAFAASLSSTAPVLRRVLPESTRDRLLLAPAS